MGSIKAWTFTSRGAPSEVLTKTDTHPFPTFPPSLPLPSAVPQPEQWILVRVSYAALNPGALFAMRLLPKSFRSATGVPDMDLVGVVEDVWSPDAKVTPRFSKSAEVIAFLPVKFTFPTGTGALQEVVAIPARYAVKKPSNVDLEEAAGLLLAGCTALRVVEDAKLKSGDRVLVNAASGGIGSFAVQLARIVVGDEGYVVGTCSTDNVDEVKTLGVNEVIDYTLYEPLSNELARRYAEPGQQFDAIIDCIGIHQLYARCSHYVKPGGVYSSVGVKLPYGWTYWSMLLGARQMLTNSLWPVTPWLGGTGRRWIQASVMEASVDTMEKLASLLGEGKIRVVSDTILEFDEAAKGYEMLEFHRTRGKIIVKVGN